MNYTQQEKVYYQGKQYCPMCGAGNKDILRTHKKVPIFPGKEFVDSINTANCTACSWKGTVHQLLPSSVKNNEDILDKNIDKMRETVIKDMLTLNQLKKYPEIAYQMFELTFIKTVFQNNIMQHGHEIAPEQVNFLFWANSILEHRVGNLINELKAKESGNN